jgi:uncharacterized protein YecE (DUF72 family)
VAAAQGRIRIGTSGWHYAHWHGPFYPEDLPRERELAYYAERFGSVEVNNSFYQLPADTSVRTWLDTVGPDFRFALKGSRYVTHMKKLKDPVQSLEKFLATAGSFGDRLGPLLFQLPPNWKPNLERLREFLEALPDGRRCTMEFRDERWFLDEVFQALREHNVAWCVYELAGAHSPREVTADFVYVRLHGPGDAYQGSYDDKTLSGWAGAMSAWAASGKDVYCYFDNDEHGYAAQNALRLQEMLD